MNIDIESSWRNVLGDYFDSKDFQNTASLAHNAYLSDTVYPESGNIFRAFELCPFDAVRVVILGQDPYHGPKQAMGLSFSVPEGIRVPPSLQNIYKEITSDLGHDSICAPKGDLTQWAEQGVLLINSVLTVEAGKAASHSKFGWQNLTDEVIRQISSRKESVVFLLWGAFAQSKAELIDQNKHLILNAPHPSPLSAHRGFLGCKHFSQTNEYLVNNNYNPVNW